MRDQPTLVSLCTRLMALMEGRGLQGGRERLLIVAATNRAEALDPGLRKPGRFDRELVIEPPNVLERIAMLQAMHEKLQPDRKGPVDFEAVAKATIGYVAADLAALHRQAFLTALERGAEDGREVSLKPLTTSDYLGALKQVGPSLMREYRLALDPSVTLDSIGGYEHVKEAFERLVIGPLREPERYAEYGLSPPRGILLYGPPGCSKTTFAKALANTAGYNFFSLNGATAFSALVGESERIVRDTFQAARLTAPSIIFLDEVDAMVGRRGLGSDGGDPVQERILSTLLNEMDGVRELRGVLVLGATNRIEAIDPAILRPGRLGYHLEVGLPNRAERLAIFQVYASRTALAEGVDLPSLAERTDGWSGADIRNLFQEAGMMAVQQDRETISQEHFETVLAHPLR